jgi:N-acyl-D-amino-acid deacylase
MDYMETLPMGINLALFIPHGTLRMAVMGLSSAKPGKGEIDAMAALVEEGMRSGAMGISTGLMYAPGSFAGPEEIEALCKVVGEYGGIYTSHIRNQGFLLVESVAETLDVGRRTGARVNISHHKATGKTNWGKVKTTCRMLDEYGEWANSRHIPVCRQLHYAERYLAPFMLCRRSGGLAPAA